MESNSDAKLQQSPLNMENELSIGEYEEASGVEEFSQQEELDYDQIYMDDKHKLFDDSQILEIDNKLSETKYNYQQLLSQLKKNPEY